MKGGWQMEGKKCELGIVTATKLDRGTSWMRNRYFHLIRRGSLDFSRAHERRWLYCDKSVKIFIQYLQAKVQGKDDIVASELINHVTFFWFDSDIIEINPSRNPNSTLGLQRQKTEISAKL